MADELLGERPFKLREERAAADDTRSIDSGQGSEEADIEGEEFERGLVRVSRQRDSRLGGPRDLHGDSGPREPRDRRTVVPGPCAVLDMPEDELLVLPTQVRRERTPCRERVLRADGPKVLRDIPFVAE